MADEIFAGVHSTNQSLFFYRNMTANVLDTHSASSSSSADAGKAGGPPLSSSSAAAGAAAPPQVTPGTTGSSHNTAVLDVASDLLTGGFSMHAVEYYREDFGVVARVNSPLETFSRDWGFPGSLFTAGEALRKRENAPPGTMEMNSDGLISFPFVSLMKNTNDTNPHRMTWSALTQGGTIPMAQFFLEGGKSSRGTGEFRGKKGEAKLIYDHTVRGEVCATWMPSRLRTRIHQLYQEISTVIPNTDKRPFTIEGGTILGDNPPGRVVLRFFCYNDWMAWFEKDVWTDLRGMFLTL